MRQQPGRIQQLRIAERCGRLADADEWREEVDRDFYAELEAYDALHPFGWDGQRIVGERVSYLIAQVNSTKKLDERDFSLVIGKRERSETEQKARWEAQAIRDGIDTGDRRHGEAAF